MDSLRFHRKHPGRVALLRLRDAGVWILYPWLLTELALPMQPDEMALQPLILRVLVSPGSWGSGFWRTHRHEVSSAGKRTPSVWICSGHGVVDLDIVSGKTLKFEPPFSICHDRMAVAITGCCDESLLRRIFVSMIFFVEEPLNPLMQLSSDRD